MATLISQIAAALQRVGAEFKAVHATVLDKADKTDTYSKSEVDAILVGGAEAPWQVKTGAYAATDGDRILADTSGGAWTLTLPASGEVFVQDVAGTWPANNLTVVGPVRGVTTDLICDLSVGLQFVRLGGAAAWVVTKCEGVPA